MCVRGRFVQRLAAGFAMGLVVGVGTPVRAQQIPIRPQPQAYADILTVVGSADVQAAPDTTDIRLGVDTEAPTAAKASTQEAATMSAVVAALRNAGIADRDLQTSQFQMEPVYDNQFNGQNGPPKLRGFRVSNIVTATLHTQPAAAANPVKTPDAGAVVDAALAAGANRVDGINFRVRDDANYRADALRKAALEAAIKARTLADALGVNLNGVASVSEGVVSSGPVPMMRGAMAAMAAPATPILAGQVSVSATVTVQYHIEKK